MSLNPVTPVTNRGVKTPWLSTEPPAGTTVLAVDENGVKSQTAADTRTLLGLATVATSASATDLTAGELNAARLPASAVTTAGSYANPAWITSLDISKITGASTAPALCIIAVGESNSGGVAPNASAFAWELASRPELQMLNTSTLLFENLDIGTNNNLNHTGLTSATHGWELELANACKREEFDRDVYYVQTGQGGATAAEWLPGAGGLAAFDSSFLPRVNAVKSIFGIRPVQYVVWLSLGINDAIAATNSYLVKGYLRTLIKAIKDELPDVKICVGRIMRTNANYEAIDDRIVELADDPAIRVVSITSLTTDGGNHWDYQGMRGFSERLLDATREMVQIPKRALTFTSTAGTVDGSLVTFSAVNQYANATETLDFSYNRSIEIDWRASMAGLLVILDTDVTEIAWSGGSDPWLLGVYENAGLFYISVTNGATTGTPFSAGGVSRLRLRKSGDDLLLESTADMTTWTLRHTATAALSGVSNVRLKMKTAVGAASVRVQSVSTKTLEPAFLVASHEHDTGDITSGQLVKARQHAQTAYLDAAAEFAGAVTSKTPSAGYIGFSPGITGYTGFLAWYMANATRLGYMGFDTGNDITLNLETGNFHIVGGNFKPTLPTSNPGPGILWNDGGTVKVGT